MNLENLKWIKNVKRHDHEWAYTHHEINQKSNTFNLHWKLKSRENAEKPDEKDLIMLKQNGKLTHIVQLLDTYSKNDDHHHKEWVYRIVKPIWMADVWNEPPCVNDIFNCEINLQIGSAINIMDVKSLKERWNLDNGVNEFQNHIAKKLKLVEHLF